MNGYSVYTDLTFWQPMATSPMAAWFVALVLLYAGREGLYQKQRGFILSYSKPIQQRLGFLVFAASLVHFALWIPLSYFWPLNICMMGLAVWPIYLSGPMQVRIDLEKKTYIAKHGWPLVPRSWEGSLSDISGIQVAQNSSSYAWMIILRFQTRHRGIILGLFSNRKKAEVAVGEVVTRLGLDVPVPYVPSLSNQVSRV